MSDDECGAPLTDEELMTLAHGVFSLHGLYWVSCGGGGKLIMWSLNTTNVKY